MSSKYAAARGSKELLVMLLSLIEEGEEIDKKTYYPKLRYMKRHKYIAVSGNTYSLTRRGRTILTERQIWNLTIPTPQKWNKKWHIVLFDIPVDKRKRRDAFRLRLRELGLVRYQDSVWLYPYPLEEIVTEIGSFYRLMRYISFVTAEKISSEKKFRRHFKV